MAALPACSVCALGEVCAPLDNCSLQRKCPEALGKSAYPLGRGRHLFRTGDAFDSVYAVHSGCVKTYAVDRNGSEHVLGFHLPGELVGLGAIHADHHPCNAIALSDSAVCAIDYGSLSALATDTPTLMQELFRCMSRDLACAFSLAGDFSAEERLASFLLNLSARLELRGLSGRKFALAMCRGDIGNYLRLATETVSRIFARFQREGLLRVERRQLELLDIPGLRAVAQSAIPYSP